MPVEQPQGTVTMLFTDIEASTRLLERLGRERYAEALELHRRVLRDAFERHGGYEVDTEGDAFFVAFARAEDGAAAAKDAQEALANTDWPDGLDVRVRMGLHTGEPLPAPPKYVGLDVHRAARIMAAAHGGQVLVSHTTHDLLGGQLRAAPAMRSLGEHRLKDLSEPQRLYELQLDGLPAEFPPPRTLENRPTNLPVQPTPLIGRAEELEELTDLLLRDDVRLLTLTGSGGTGKTRLALHAAGELVEHFAEGVYVVALAPVSDPALVVPIVAQTLGVREEAEQQLDATLAAHLRTRTLLLVLDNFEQVLDAAPAVAGLLQHAPNVKIVVTSRAPLHLSGEREYAVQPLAVPADGKVFELPALSQCDSVALFIARAQAVDAHFNLTNDNGPAVAGICVRLDGLPLAIELAAARVRVLPPRALLARLDRSLRLLTGGAADLPTRQQTLRATIDWSYGLLTPDEQRLFTQLAVFVGGCTLDAVETVLGERTGLDVLDGLGRLVERSLVRQREDASGQPRFSMLETIREYALERLAELPAAYELRRAHAEYYLKLARAVEADLRNEVTAASLERLDEDGPNLTEALLWASENDGTLQGDLANALARPWALRGRLREGQRWVEDALARGDEGASSGRNVTLRWATYLAGMLGEGERTEAFISEWLASARQLGDRQSEGEAVFRLGELRVESGEIELGRKIIEEGLTLARELDDPELTAKMLGILGVAAREEGDHAAAATFFEQACSLHRSVGSRFNLAISLQKVGMARIDSGQLRDAAAPLREALEILREFGNDFEISFVLEGFAVLIAADDPLGAARLLGKGDALREPSNARLERHEEHRVKRATASTRAQLDEAEWARAWAEGRRMSLDDAIALTVAPHGTPAPT